MKRAISILAILFISFLMIEGCNESTSPTTSEQIVGKWAKDIVSGDDIEEMTTVIIEFNNEGKYFVSSTNVVYTFKGNYNIEGNNISMFDESCGMEVEGKYELNFSGDKVNFKLVSDTCNRNEDLPGDWYKYTE